MPLFHILNCSTREPVTFRDAPRVFETGNDAKAFITDVLAINHPGIKFQPRPVADEAIDWRARERNRFETGEYLAVADELLAHCNVDHFVHVSRDKPMLIAFTKDANAGLRDIQTRRTVRAYLDEFCADLTEATRQRLCDDHMAKFGLIDLHWAISGKEIVHAYTNFDSGSDSLSSSCMRHTRSSAFSCCHVHPVSVYGDSDLRLAYLKDDSGDTTARALVYEKHKVYTRVYGNAMSSKLHSLLKAAGYRKSETYWLNYNQKGEDLGPSFAGARIRRIENEHSCGGYIMPYVDDVSVCEENGRWWVLGYGSTDCQVTDGYIEGDDNRAYCERCEDYVNEDDTTYVITSLGASTWNTSGSTWCDHCAQNYTFRCEGSGDVYDERNVDSVEVEGETYSLRYAEANFTRCEHNDEWYTSSTSFESVIVDDDGELETWSEHAISDSAFKCVITGDLYHHDLAADNTLVCESGAWSGRFVGADCGLQHVLDWIEYREANPLFATMLKGTGIAYAPRHIERPSLTIAL